MSYSFERFFHSSDPARDQYLSRLFALFGEQVVRAWYACPEAPYEDRGRPTLYCPDEARGHTIDFTLRRRDSARTYVAELKCELEYDRYRYLRLTGPDQLKHHTSPAFAKFLQVASDPTGCRGRWKGQWAPVDGAILIWGAVAPEGRGAAMAAFAFADVLSVEAMLADLRTWGTADWAELVGRHHGWTEELFALLADSNVEAGSEAEQRRQPSGGEMSPERRQSRA